MQCDNLTVSKHPSHSGQRQHPLGPTRFVIFRRSLCLRLCYWELISAPCIGTLCGWHRLLVKVPLKNAKSAYQTLHFFPSHYDILSCKLLSVILFTHCVPASTFTISHPRSTFTCFAKDFFFSGGFSEKGWSTPGKSIVAVVNSISLWIKTNLGWRHGW